MRITSDDMQLFSAASHDRNPLHLSADYAHRTPFGQPVVFGVLAALACLGRLKARPEASLAKVVCDFQGALQVDVDYSLVVTEDSPEKAIVTLCLGSREQLAITAEFRPDAPRPATCSWDSWEPLESPRQWDISELKPGTRLAGPYAPAAAELAELADRFRLRQVGIGDEQLAALLWSSYFVGMEVPGQAALFNSLSLTFDGGGTTDGRSLAVDAVINRYDRRFSLVRVSAALTMGDRPLAQASLTAFVRQEVPAVALQDLQALLPPSDALAGKVAWVTGGSRGLGAVLVQLLALQGCTVYAGYHQSREAAEAMQQTVAGAGGKVVLVPGDVGDPGHCQGVAERIAEEAGGLDFLICTAAPALHSCWLEPADSVRIVDFIGRSVNQIVSPMAVCLTQLSARQGACVVLSSEAVVEPTPQWPHYVAAKMAVEGLVRVAAIQYPQVGFLVPRPPKLLTDLINTPLGRVGAVATGPVAAQIVRQVMAGVSLGAIAMMDSVSAAP